MDRSRSQLHTMQIGHFSRNSQLSKFAKEGPVNSSFVADMGYLISLPFPTSLVDTEPELFSELAVALYSKTRTDCIVILNLLTHQNMGIRPPEFGVKKIHF